MGDAVLDSSRKPWRGILEIVLTFGLAGWLGGLTLFTIKSLLHEAITDIFWASSLLELPYFITKGWIVGCIIGILFIVVQMGFVSRKSETNVLFIRNGLRIVKNGTAFYRTLSIVLLLGLVLLWRWGVGYRKHLYALLILITLFLLGCRFIVTKSRQSDGLNIQVFFMSFFTAVLHAGVLVYLVRFSMKLIRIQGQGQKLVVYGMIVLSSMVVLLSVWTCIRRWMSSSGIDTTSWKHSLIPVLILVITVVSWPLSLSLLKHNIPTENQKNVIIIGIDTLRHDHVNLEDEGKGISRDITPRMRELAQQGTVFQTAVSQSSWTLPAFASLMTGRYPHQHGANEFNDVMGGHNVTLAEILSAAGYSTEAVVTHVFVNSDFGFAQGFDNFNEKHVAGHWSITSEQVTDEAISILEKKKDPFFLFLHYFDPHYAFRDHQEWTFSDDYSGWLSSGERTRYIAYLLNERHAFDSSDIQYLVDLYDEEIAFTDYQIGRLFRSIHRMDLDKNTMIIVVGDHGEEFMERGWLGHGNSMYDEVIRVPLFIVLPEEERVGKTISAPVETRAVFKTVLDYLGIAWNSQPLPSLWDLIRDHTQEMDPEKPPFTFSTVWRPRSSLTSGRRIRIASIRSEKWKLIHDFSRAREMFFDLINDPGEKTPVLQTSDLQEEYRAILMEWLDAMGGFRPTTAKGKLNKKQIERLKSLGYF